MTNSEYPKILFNNISERTYIEGVIYVLNKVINMIPTDFNKSIPENLLIIQNPDFNVPSSDSNGQLPIIRLCVPDDNYYDQYVFQFSHELCHMLIRYPQNASVRAKDSWFEEVICEVSSRFFLYKMSISNELQEIQGYLKNFAIYAQKREETAINIDVTTLSQENSPQLIKFRNEIINDNYANLETRKQYNYIANAIYPIFSENPELWKEVPLIYNFDDKNTFIQNLQNWYLECTNETNKQSVNKIIELFKS